MGGTGTSRIKEGGNVLLDILHDRIRPLLDLQTLRQAERLQPGDRRLRDPNDLLHVVPNRLAKR